MRGQGRYRDDESQRPERHVRASFALRYSLTVTKRSVIRERANPAPVNSPAARYQPQATIARIIAVDI